MLSLSIKDNTITLKYKYFPSDNLKNSVPGGANEK